MQAIAPGRALWDQGGSDRFGALDMQSGQGIAITTQGLRHAHAPGCVQQTAYLLSLSSTKTSPVYPSSAMTSSWSKLLYEKHACVAAASSPQQAPRDQSDLSPITASMALDHRGYNLQDDAAAKLGHPCVWRHHHMASIAGFGAGVLEHHPLASSSEDCAGLQWAHATQELTLLRHHFKPAAPELDKSTHRGPI